MTEESIKQGTLCLMVLLHNSQDGELSQEDEEFKELFVDMSLSNLVNEVLKRLRDKTIGNHGDEIDHIFSELAKKRNKVLPNENLSGFDAFTYLLQAQILYRLTCARVDDLEE